MENNMTVMVEVPIEVIMMIFLVVFSLGVFAMGWFARAIYEERKRRKKA
jgi:ABC-type Na+ efflux pump permease subunit